MKKEELIKVLKEQLNLKGNYNDYAVDSKERINAVGNFEGISLALGFVGELEEPSVSNETVNDILDSNRKLSKRIKELENQLEEPQQWKVVVPQFVADWIEDKKDWTAFEVFYDIDEQNIESDKVSKWLYDNDDEENAKREIVLLQALRSGYTVEKEKLYRVKLLPINRGYLAQWDGTSLQTGYADEHECYENCKTIFTEQEIKAFDERFWTFAEEITK